jgi:hypothetical protein
MKKEEYQSFSAQTIRIETTRIVNDANETENYVDIDVQTADPWNASLACILRRNTPFNQQITLNTTNPTKSYFFNLTNGDTISITISVTGDAINFHIFNSTDGQLLSKHNTQGVQESWTVPYNGRFEFHVETSGNEANVTITLTSSSQPGQTGTGGFDPTLIIIITVIVVAGIVTVALILHMRKSTTLPPPPQTLPPPPPPLT